MFLVTPDHYLSLNVLKGQLRPTCSRGQTRGQLVFKWFGPSKFNATEICMYVCMYVCMCVCVYIYIYTHTHISASIYIYIYIYWLKLFISECFNFVVCWNDKSEVMILRKICLILKELKSRKREAWCVIGGFHSGVVEDFPRCYTGRLVSSCRRFEWPCWWKYYYHF